MRKKYFYSYAAILLASSSIAMQPSSNSSESNLSHEVSALAQEGILTKTWNSIKGIGQKLWAEDFSNITKDLEITGSEVDNISVFDLAVHYHNLASKMPDPYSPNWTCYPIKAKLEKLSRKLVFEGDNHKANQNNQEAERFYKKSEAIKILIKQEKIDFDDELNNFFKGRLHSGINDNLYKAIGQMSLTDMCKLKQELIEKEKTCIALQYDQQAKVARRQIKFLDNLLSLDAIINLNKN